MLREILALFRLGRFEAPSAPPGLAEAPPDPTGEGPRAPLTPAERATLAPLAEALVSEPAELLTPRDLARLQGVHPDLVRVVRRARRMEPFTVLEGLRTRERQAQLVSEGRSRTMNSRHLTGHAVDLGPVPLDWDNRAAFHALARAMGKAAEIERVPITWGGTFRGFFDGPHFELPRDRYPAE